MENNEMEKEIQEAIAKSLPKQVGDVLALRLERLSSLEEENTNLKKIAEQRAVEINQIKDEKNRLRDSLNKHGELDLREKEVERKERNLKISELEIQLQAERNIQAAYDRFLMSLTKNQTIKETVSKNLLSGTDYNNGSSVRYPTGESTLTTREVE